MTTHKRQNVRKSNKYKSNITKGLIGIGIDGNDGTSAVNSRDELRHAESACSLSNYSERRVAFAVGKRPVRVLSEDEKRRFGNVLLVSKRGSKHNITALCDECGHFSHKLWKYARSDRGSVFLCDRCKPYVYERSFGSIDALDHAETGGHRFEGNRHRH